MKIYQIFLLILVLLGSLFIFGRVLAPTPSFFLPLNKEEIEGGSSPPITTLIVVGDILLSRNVGTKIDQAKDPNLPFLKVSEFLNSADITFGNLECPLDPGNIRIREGLVFRCLTKDFEGVINSGFDALSTANNHAFDQGLDNLEFTIDYLKSQNILPIGTSKPDAFTNSIELVNNKKAGILKRNNIKFGFLSYSYSAHNDGGETSAPHIATMADLKQLREDLANLKTKTDVVIVNIHAGTEYTRHPTQKQIDFAHAAIEAGADLVIGEHPHWIQTVEVYSPTAQLSPDEGRVPRTESRGREVRGGLIFYSLGNFVFDQQWSEDTKEGLMVKFTFEGKKLEKAELVPVIIENNCCPRLANEKEKLNILQKIELATDIITFP